ncbi:MAG: bifunctional DNA-formamidopyrimidine glycosylase/DNA-(apurinic or apyrimidinic site) lyase [Myxococcales bacterium]|nr:bifunctional DNA-formamidopyrimidine glycosylase/DNA-(apurinic or apyrimidinic site) lyase [Myxococcales bacterium]
MPELPEVETVCRHLAGWLPGAELIDAAFSRPDLRYPMPAAAIEALCGRRCAGVRRRAKYLLLDIEALGAAPAWTVLIHLGMSGRVSVDDLDPLQGWRRHEHWRLQWRGARGPFALHGVDPRRFGALLAFPAAHEAEHPLLAGLGPEPFGPHFTPRAMQAAAMGRTTSIKAWLLDARSVAGVGNIYASEACWRARLDPRRPVGSLSAVQCAALVAAVRSVLDEAIAAGGTTLRDFVSGDGSPGYFQQRLDAYGRHGEPCPRCTATIVRVVQGQRATFLCEACQR